MIKKFILFIGAISLGFSCVSCNTTDATVGLPIPFTDPSVRVNLETKITPLPPRVCIGLDVVED